MTACGCHPDYHELGVHRPDYRPDPSTPCPTPQEVATAA
jgi:hypothetical protein